MGRGLVIKLMGAPFILPVLVAILGLIAVFGQNGWVNIALRNLGIANFSIYGLQGILLAHVFFNLPLATRLILLGWATVPQERLRLAQHLDLTPSARFRLIEFPMLANIIPSTFVVIFCYLFVESRSSHSTRWRAKINNFRACNLSSFPL